MINLRISKEKINYFNDIANFKGIFEVRDLTTMQNIVKKVINPDYTIVDIVDDINEEPTAWADGLIDVLKDENYLGLQTRMPEYVIICKPRKMIVNLNEDVRRSVIVIDNEDFYYKSYDLIDPEDAENFYHFTKDGKFGLRIHSVKGKSLIIHHKGSIYHRETLYMFVREINKTDKV